MTSPTTNLDAIAAALATFEQRHRALVRGWDDKSGTRALNAGFASMAAALASLRATVDDALADRAAWLQGPWKPQPLTAAQERAAYLAPECIAERAVPVITVTAADAVVSLKVACVQCSVETDRAEAEPTGGLCLDCHLVTKSTVAADVSPTSEAEASAPPALGGSPVVGADVGGAVGQLSAPTGSNGAHDGEPMPCENYV